MMKKNSLARAVSLILCLLMMLPASVFAQQAPADYSGHWAEKQIKSFLDKGFIGLYSDGSFKPNSPITRADFAAIANKAFGFTEKDKTNFKDVKQTDAFYDDMAIAKKAGYLTGLPDGTVKPNSSMSRQEYAVIICRLLKLDVNKDIAAAGKFKDAAKIPAWSKGAIGAAVKLGYMQGDANNTFDPNGPITRGQAVAVLERCYLDNVKVAYNKAGTYSEKNVEGSVAINVSDVTLENTSIAGNLIIGEGVGAGNVKLKNVAVGGETIVRGGGPNSIVVEDCQMKNLTVAKTDNKIRIVAAGKTTIEKVDMQSGGKLEEQGTAGSGFVNVTIGESVAANESVVLQGSFESVVVQAANVRLDVAAGSVARLEVAQTAANAQVNLGAGTTVANLVVNSAAAVGGAGKVGTAQVNVQGAVITAPTTTITAAAGVTVATTTPTIPAPAPTPAPSSGGSSGGGGGSSGGGNGGGGNSTPSITIGTIAAQTVNVGSSIDVAVNSTPAGASKSATSSNNAVATVVASSNAVKVTGVAEGMATITVTCTQSGYRSASTTFTVTVTQRTVAIEPIAEQSVSIGASIDVTVKSTPSDATVNASSSNTSVATATVSGNTVAVKGISEGTATITVKGTKEGYKDASISFSVNVTPYKLSMSDDGNIVEGSEDGELITVSLTGAKFADTLTPANWTLKNLPEGVTRGAVTRVSDTKATIALSGNRTEDYDSDVTNVQLTCQAAEISGAKSQTSCSGGVVLKAVNDAESISVAWAATPGTNGAEATMNGEALTVKLAGGTFVRNNINDITLAGTSVTDAHITKQSVTWISSKELRIDLAWDGTDYDENKVLTVNIPVSAYADSNGGATLTGNITCTATAEPENQTADMALALTVPSAGGGNSISVGGGIKTGEVNVVNGTGSVVLTGTKTVTQTVEISGADKDAVTAGGTETAPTFTVNTEDIAAAGGSKAFILTVSEAGKSSITYNITVKVAAKAVAEPLAQVADVELSAAGNATWTDVDNESGYSVQLYKDGSEQGTKVDLPADTTTYSFTAEIKAGGAGVYTVKVTAIGDGDKYKNGPQSEASNSISIIQLATVTELVWVDNVAHWKEVTGADSYDVYLFRDEIKLKEINVATSEVDFTADIMVGQDGAYTFKVVAKSDAVTEADAEMSAASAARVKNAAADQPKLDADEAALDIGDYLGANSAVDNITTALETLPESLSNGTAVVWTSDKPAVISNDGQTVNRPAWEAEDATVIMTAALTNGWATGTKTFTLTVKRIDGTDKQKLDADKAALNIGAYLGENSAADKITTALGTLPTLLPNGTTVVWTSSNRAVISNNGQEVERPTWESGDAVVTMTATLTNGSATDTKTFTLIVKSVEGTEAQKLAADKAALEVSGIPLKSNTTLDRIRSSLGVLPTLLKNGTTVVWTSDKPTIVSDNGQTVNRPAADTEVIMTANLTNGSKTDELKFTLLVRKPLPNSLSRPATSTLDKTGAAQWYDISNEVGYVVRLYKGKYVLDKDKYVVVARYLAANETKTDFRNDMLGDGPGGYFISVQGIGDYVNYEDGGEYESQVITLLESPENLYWDGKVAHWSSVANAEEYQVKLYRDGMLELGTGKTVTAENIAAGVDYTAEIEAGIGGVYTFRVVAKSSNSRTADSGEAESSGIAKLSQTAYMRLELTSPTGNGNTIGVGGSVKTGTIGVVNGTTSVVLKGTKTAQQSVTIGGMNKGSVTIDETDPLAPVFTINTAAISAGGNEAFTLTVSENGYSDVVYNITLGVAAKQPVFAKDGIVSWEDTAYETKYLVQLLVGGKEVNIKDKPDIDNAAKVELPANTTSYDFSSVMDEISKAGGGQCTVTVKALDESKTYPDGPALESNRVDQLAAPELVYYDEYIGAFIWMPKYPDGKYIVVLYKNGTEKITEQEGINGEEDFYNEIKAAGDGIYSISITNVSLNLLDPIQRDSVTVMSSNTYTATTTADIGLKLDTPAPDESNTITDSGKGKIRVDVANGTQSVKLLGVLTGDQKIKRVVGINIPIDGEAIGKPQFVIGTSSIAEAGGSATAIITIAEEQKLDRTYDITVVVAPSTIGSLFVSASDDNLSDDKTVIHVVGNPEDGNEFVYKNFGIESTVLPALDDVVSAGWTELPVNGIIAAANGDHIAVVERRIGTNKAKKAGETTAVVEAEVDTTAPVFVTGPEAQNIGTTELTLFAKLDEAGTVYYAVYADGAAAPTPAELKAIGDSVDTAADTNEASIAIEGLQAGTAYDIYVIAEDRNGNLQADVILVKIETQD